VGADVGLDEDDRALRVYTSSNKKTGHLSYLGLQNGGLLQDGDGMEVNETKDVVELSLRGYPMPNCAQIVTYMDITGWLKT
jgi:hypothetical protein